MVTEERIAALEAEIAQIKAQLKGERYGMIGRTNPQLLEEMYGYLANEPESEEVWRSIESEREREREEVRKLLENDN